MSMRVLIADDQPRARRSLKALLTALRWSTLCHPEQPTQADFSSVEIVGEAENGEQAIEQVRSLHPDVVVMDLGMQPGSLSGPHMDGLAAIRIIRREWPAVRIVVLTMYTTFRASVLAAGVDAFLLKGCPTSELLEAVMPAAC